MEIEIEEEINVEVADILRIELDGDFTPSSLGKLLICIEDIYRTILLLENTSVEYDRDNNESKYVIRRPLPPNEEGEEKTLVLKIKNNALIPYNLKIIYELTSFFPKRDLLQLTGINYNSPGAADILGLGEILKQIKEFVLEIIKHKSERTKRKLSEMEKAIEIEQKKAQLQKMKLDNAKQYIEIAKELGFDNISQELLKDMLSNKQDTLFELVDNNNITNAKMISSEEA
jgi:hypothetical protein